MDALRAQHALEEAEEHLAAIRETATPKCRREAEMGALQAQHALAEAEERLAAIRETATPKSADLAEKDKGSARKASLGHDFQTPISHEPTPEPLLSSCTVPSPPPPSPPTQPCTSNKKCNSVGCERLRDRPLGKNWKLSCSHCLDHGPPKTKKVRTSMPTAKRATIQRDIKEQAATKNNVASKKDAKKNAKEISQHIADELAEWVKPKVRPPPVKRLLPKEFATDTETELPKPKARKVVKAAAPKSKATVAKAKGKRKPKDESPSPSLSGSDDNSDGAEVNSDDVIVDETSEASDDDD